MPSSTTIPIKVEKGRVASAHTSSMKKMGR